MNKYLFIGIGVLLFAGVGFYVVAGNSSQEKPQKVATNTTNTTSTDHETGSAMKTQDAPDSVKDVVVDEGDKMVQSSGFVGNVLAGSESPYIEFNQADYDKAVADGKFVVLDFYSSWCPTCRGEAPHTYKAFDTLNNPNVVGFRVNWKDDDTDANEKRLSSQLKIPSQYAKVFIQNGKEVHRTYDIFKAGGLVDEIKKVL